MIPQQRATKRHEKILDAALRVFARKGYRDAAVDDIANESKTSKGGVYFHFPGKQAIFLELLNRTASRLRSKIQEAIESETDPLRRADAALLAVLRTFASHRAIARLFMIEALGAGKEFHQRLSEIHAEFASIIKEQLDDAVSQGVIPPLDTQVAATAWFGALNEVMTSWLLSGKPARLQDAYDALRPLLIRSVGVQEPERRRTFEEDLGDKLAATLDRGATAARTQGRPVLTCLALPCPGFDPVVLFAAARVGRPAAFWHQPSQGLALVAAGESVQIPASGPGRFDEARVRLKELAGAAWVEAGAAPFEPPVALAAFAFSGRDGAGPQAAEMGSDTHLVVPRLLFVTRAAENWLLASVRVDATTDIAAEAARLQDEVLVLLATNLPAPGSGGGARLLPCEDGDAWRAATAAAIEEMSGAGIEKAVLARAVEVASDQNIDVPAALRRMVERYRTCTLFAFDVDGACFIGATPERLLRVEDGLVTVDCLAGSISRGAAEGDDRALASRLLHDPKELHEHKVVVSAIEAALQPLTASLEVAPTPRIVTFANVHHLFTPVTGVALPGHDIFEFVESLHPTPATGGHPREAALPLISKYETFDRGWYAGPIGWVDAAGNGDFAVAIRSAIVRANTATLFAGSGIVQESDPAKEYDETNVKLRAMLWSLGVEE